MRLTWGCVWKTIQSNTSRRNCLVPDEVIGRVGRRDHRVLLYFVDFYDIGEFLKERMVMNAQHEKQGKNFWRDWWLKSLANKSENK
jgi:hypothetical protein